MSSIRRILIVEKDRWIVDILKTYLEMEEFEVIAAYDGKSALEYFNKINPSLAILDLVLPDMDGEIICKEIKRNSKIPILIATAKSDEASILSAFRIGADDYMTKPYSPRLLVARVTALLRRTSAANFFPLSLHL